MMNVKEFILINQKIGILVNQVVVPTPDGQSHFYTDWTYIRY
jgi:hypothetical protein